ncbi:MAG TPA: helix-turn-helix transcriptional regulator [Gaiellaceae bacterium]|nr:helix-turn-helix transcriptional regulator [Gaiellaceae bacterium]
MSNPASDFVRADRRRRPSRAQRTTRFHELSSRELEVLALLADGLSNSEIGQRLSISPHTATDHTRSVIAKLGANARAEAVAIGFRQGLLV